MIVVRREVFKETWEQIASNPKVKNHSGEQPLPRHVANTYRKFNARTGQVEYKYNKCGRKPDKATPEVKKYLVKKLCELRIKSVCTSTVLQ